MIKYNESWGFLLNAVSLILPPGKVGAKVRGCLYRPFLKHCGANLKIAQRVYILKPNKLTVGDNVWLGYNCYIGEGEVEIGSNALIGPFVSITASNHNNKNGSFRFTGYTEQKIKLGENIWIGAHACILAGISIGKGSLVAAGAVVNKNIGEGEIVGGVPAKIIKKLE